MKNEEVLHRVKKERNIRHTIKRRKASWPGHILRRNYLRRHVIDGKIDVEIEVEGKRGRRRKQRLGDLNTLRTGDADLRFYITTVQDG